jgi:hypothetical protein
MINWLFTPFNDLEDRPIDVISFFVLLPPLVYVAYKLLEIYG